MTSPLNSEGDARAPLHATAGEYWLIFDSARYVAENGGDALEAALVDLRAAGLRIEGYEGRDDCVWTVGAKPAYELMRRYGLHAPNDDHPVGEVVIEL